MSYETVDLWVFEPADGSCDECGQRQGVYSYEVEPPHPNCHCTVKHHDVSAELIATREELIDQYELVEEVTWVARGDESTVEQNWSTGTETTVSGEVSAEGSGIGATVGGSRAVTAGSGGSKSVTFRYDADVGGSNQMIAARYEVKVYQTIQTYQLNWLEGRGTDFQFEVIAATREVRAFTGYHKEAF